MPSFKRAFVGPLAAAILIPSVSFAQDLAPESMQIDAREPNPSVSVTVTNLSGMTVPNGATVAVYADTPLTGTLLGSLTTTIPLQAGQSETLVFPLGSGYAFTRADGVPRSLYAVTDPHNTVAESNESNNQNFAYRWVNGINPPVPRTHRVLVVTVVGPAYAGHGPQLAQTVTWAGGTVTHMYTNGAGASDPATALANGAQYDQIWVYDLSSATDTGYAADFAQIAAWYNQDRSRDIIADGRMIASLWSNRYTTEGRVVYENYYENLRIRGGGLVLGTDHGANTGGPTAGYGVFVDGINRINDAIGIGRFWGNPGGSTAGMQTNDPNPIRTIPNNLGAGINSQSSPGNAPTGFQDASNIAPGGSPLQRTFYTVAWHNGSSGGGAATPAVSTTVVGALGFNIAVQAPCRVANPGQSNLLTLNISNGAIAPLTYEWTSSISGIVSTGPTLDTATLPAGEHTINVTVRDATGFRPGDSVLVSVGGPDCNMSCIPDAEEIANGTLADTLPANGIPDSCEDADGDGTQDGLDQAPCDPLVQAVTYGPAQDTLGQLMYEDLWPGWTDLDFNDVVVAWNSSSQIDTSGAASKLRFTFYVLAVGGDLDNGLGMQLPVPAGAVTSVTRSVAGGPAQSIGLRPADTSATFLVSSNTREFFGGQAGPINSISGQNTPPVQVVVDVTLNQAVAMGAATPWDVFVFRTGDVSHQIHFPQYGGTAEMNTALFGQTNDASTPGRWFVDTTGLPYALSVPQLVPWPLEQTQISLLYPDILNFAASGGATNQDWYLTNVNLANAFGGPAWTAPSLGPIPGPVIDRSCVGF